MNFLYRFLVTLSIILFVSCKSTTNHTTKNSKTSLYKDEVFACYYHSKFNGRKTASGAIFSNNKNTAAHKKLAFGTEVLVTNLENNESIVVEINDRGPFTKGLEIDLSKKAFDAITHDKNAGKLKVKIELINDSK